MTTREQAIWQAYEDYSRFQSLAPEDWPELPMVAVRVEREAFAADEAAFRKVRKTLSTAGQEGWVRFRSGLDWTGNTETGKVTFPETGAPLYAEWCETENTSVRLRQDPDQPGSLVLWRYTERPLKKPGTLQKDETTWLCEETALLAHPRNLPGARLCYHVYWGAPEGEEPHALRRVFDRFTGFAHKETGS